MQPRSQWTEEERVWFELFKAALTGTSNAECYAESDCLRSEQRAKTIADKALGIVGEYIKPKEPPPLFSPLLKEIGEQQKKDETDASFKVTR